MSLKTQQSFVTLHAGHTASFFQWLTFVDLGKTELPNIPTIKERVTGLLDKKYHTKV